MKNLQDIQNYPLKCYLEKSSRSYKKKITGIKLEAILIIILVLLKNVNLLKNQNLVIKFIN